MENRAWYCMILSLRGLDFSERLYDLHNELLRQTHSLVAGCQCSDGCPSCVGPGGEGGAGGRRKRLDCWSDYSRQDGSRCSSASTRQINICGLVVSLDGYADKTTGSFQLIRGTSMRNSSYKRRFNSGRLAPGGQWSNTHLEIKVESRG